MAADQLEDDGRGIHESRIEPKVVGEVDREVSPDDLQRVAGIEGLVVLEAGRDAVQPGLQQQPGCQQQRDGEPTVDPQKPAPYLFVRHSRTASTTIRTCSSVRPEADGR